MALASAAGCAGPYGGPKSYITGVVAPANVNVVYHWTDIALQALRDQLVAPPLASRALAMGHVAGFLAVNGIQQRYDNGYAIEDATQGADPHVAYGVAAATAFAEHFQQPLVFDRMKFLAHYPEGEAKTLGRQWGRRVGRFIVRERTNDGAGPSKINFYLKKYTRRHDALRWRPTAPMFDSGGTEPAFRETYHRGLLPGFGKVKPWAMRSADQFMAPKFF